MLIYMLAKFAREDTILTTQYTMCKFFFINVNHNSFKMSRSGDEMVTIF